MPLQCWDGQLPDLAAAAQYRAIFITGSHYSAYEDLPWISNLVAWLHSFVMGASCATKIVAVCFGSQVISSVSVSSNHILLGFLPLHEINLLGWRLLRCCTGDCPCSGRKDRQECVRAFRADW